MNQALGTVLALGSGIAEVLLSPAGEAGLVPVGVWPGWAGAYFEAHLAWSWVAWKTPSWP